MHLVLFTKSLKLAGAQNLTLNMNLLAFVSPFQSRRMGFPLGKFPTKVGLYSRWWSTGAVKERTIHVANTNKKQKRNLPEFDSGNETTEFPRFIVLESLEQTCLVKLSLFLIEK